METIRKKILLVEDEAICAMQGEQTLRNLGYEVLRSANGEKAIADVQENPGIALILMDIDLGRGIDGPEAAARILEGRDLPIMFMSSHAEAEIVEKTERIPAYGFLVKNTVPAILDASIKMAFKLFETKRKTDSDDLRRLAETKLKDNLSFLKPSSPKKLSHLSLETLMNELQVHQVELEMQNDELRRAQRELEASRQRYFELYDLAPVGYCTLSATGLIEEANLTATVLLGLDRQALVRQPVSRFIRHDDQDIFYHQRKALEEGGESRNFDLGLKKADGQEFWGHLVLLPVRDPDGGIVQIRLTLSDVSARKAAESTIQKLLGEKELLLKEVHHRIKNNMTTIYGLLAMQADTLTIPAARAALHDAASRVRSMMVLYDKLYQSPGLHQLSLEEYLPALAQEILAVFPASRTVRLTCAVDTVMMDARRLQPVSIILNELLTNVMKYSFANREDGTITLKASRQGQRVVISVQDDGIGLPESVGFENSSGYGLLVVSALTDQLDGTIRIERDRGTRFVLEIPFE